MPKPGEQNGTATPIPPNNPSAEESVLGAVLLSKDALAEVADTLNPDDFYHFPHQHIYAAVLELHRQGAQADPVTVAAALDRKGLTEQTGGIQRLLALQSATPRTKNIGGYAELIASAAARRRLISAAGDIAAYGYDESGPVDEAIAKAAARLSVAMSPGDEPSVGYYDTMRAALLEGDAIKNLPAPDPLIDGILDRDSLAAIYGPSGAGKSFVVIDWALSLATGSYWFSHRIVRSRVLYVVAEGATGMNQRVEAWQHARRTYDVGDIVWLPVPVDLFEKGHAADVARLATEMKPGLVVVDTLARSMPGGDENSARDVGQVVANADRIRRATGACVLLVHHTGKDATRGLRGNTALEGAMDTTIECRTTEDGAVELTATKQKNRESGHKTRLRLVKERESCVLEVYRGALDDGTLPPSAEFALRTLDEIDTGEGVSRTIWAGATELAERTFARWVPKLLDLRLVEESKVRGVTKYSVTLVGKNALGVVDLGEHDEEAF